MAKANPVASVNLRLALLYFVMTPREGSMKDSGKRSLNDTAVPRLKVGIGPLDEFVGGLMFADPGARKTLLP